MNGWADDDDVEEEDEENEDADIKEADDEPEAEEADDELEVEEAGVEPEAEGADVELEAEELDGVPEATIGTGSQRAFVVRDFPMGFYEAGESSTARDPQFVGGLALWALRRDLEVLRRHERIREAESETSRTEVSLIMPPKPISEARMREIIRDQCATSMNEFMANMNSGAGGSGGACGSGGAGGSSGTGGNADETGVRGTGPTVPELTGMKGMDIDGYTNRFHELALLCPRMVEPEAVKVEQYIRGFEKRKGESDRGGRGDNRCEHNHCQNQRRGNAGAMTNAAPNNNETCQKYKNKRHAGDC
nr:hypothetical protein [Tanacetum cinerariifolium]